VFSPDDHFDAYVVFEFLTLRAKRKYGGNLTSYNFYVKHVTYYWISVRDDPNFGEIKIRAGERNAFELVS